MITTYRPSALETLKKELNETLGKQIECVNDYGIVKTFMRQEYQRLTIKAKLIKESIDFLEELRSRR